MDKFRGIFCLGFFFVCFFHAYQSSVFSSNCKKPEFQRAGVSELWEVLQRILRLSGVSVAGSVLCRAQQKLSFLPFPSQSVSLS